MSELKMIYMASGSWKRATCGAMISLAVLVCLFAGAISLYAQANMAQMTGVVKDSTGAVMPGVLVKAIVVDKGTESTTVTNEAGVYRFQALLPDNYVVECGKAGFKPVRKNGIVLDVNQILSLDITLHPGEVKEEVTVTAETLALDTTSANVGQIVTSRTVEAMPLNLRDPISLVALTPGVVLGSGFGETNANTGVARNFFKSDFYVGGGRSGSQEIILDGAPDMTADLNRAIINPPPDSVQEFKVQANTVDAQFGRTSGGVMNMITKSGTNEFHGTVYEFAQNALFDANLFFNRLHNVAKSDFSRNQFGGVVGGPIKKNKMFFFGDWEELRQSQPFSATSTVPTDAERMGDFSQLQYKASAGVYKPITIYDPLTQDPANPINRLPFAGNKIPSTRLDPVVQALLKAGYYPEPNITPSDTITNINNYYYTDFQTVTSYKWDVRGDYRPSDKLSFFGRFSRQEDSRYVPRTSPNPDGGHGGTYVYDHYTQAILDASYSIRPNLFAEIGTSFSRGMAIQVGGLAPMDITTLGFSNTYASQIAKGLPQFTNSDVASLVQWSALNQQHQPRNTYATHAFISLLKGQHSLKFGAEERSLHYNEYGNGNITGTFAFSRGFTQLNTATPSAAAGFDWASELLGYPNSSSSVQKVAAVSSEGFYWAGYVQDDFRLLRNLSINAGLRYEVAIGTREKYNRIAYFDPDAISPLAGQGSIPNNLRGSVEWTGKNINPISGATNYNPTNQSTTNHTDIGPRFGFSWQPLHNTTIRGSYGIFYVPRNISTNGAGGLETSISTSLNASQDNGSTPWVKDNPVCTSNCISMANPYPTGVIVPANDRSMIALIGTGISLPEHINKESYVQMYSLGIQQALPWKLLVEAYYWGNKGTHMRTQSNINQMADNYWLGIPAKAPAGVTALNSAVPNPYQSYASPGSMTGTTMTYAQSLVPFPQYTGVTQSYYPIGISNYNAGSIKVERRMSDSLTFFATFTMQRSLDNLAGGAGGFSGGLPYNSFHREWEYERTSYDVPHQFQAQAVFDLPFGRGRRYGAHLNSLANGILGGWQIAGLGYMQSGFPVAISRNSEVTGSAALAHPTINAWFNTSVIKPAVSSLNTSTTTYNAYGTVGPWLQNVRISPARNIDANISKSVPITIRDHAYKVDLRVEGFNILDYTQFAAPNGTITSGSFGTVTSTQNYPRVLQFAAKLKF